MGNQSHGVSVMNESTPEMRAALDAMALAMFGRSPKECESLGICVGCGGPATEFVDAISRKEYTLSTFCQKCQDETFQEPEEDDDQ